MFVFKQHKCHVRCICSNCVISKWSMSFRGEKYYVIVHFIGILGQFGNILAFMMIKLWSHCNMGFPQDLQFDKILILLIKIGILCYYCVPYMKVLQTP